MLLLPGIHPLSGDRGGAHGADQRGGKRGGLRSKHTMTRLLGLLLTVLPLCLTRPCGQKELKERHIGGCTSFEHIKLVGKGGAVRLPTTPASGRVLTVTCVRHRSGSATRCTTTPISSCSTCTTPRSAPKPGAATATLGAS